MALIPLLMTAQATALAPIDGWAVVRGDQRTCVATRYYGDPSAPTLARLAVVAGTNYAATLTLEFAPDWSLAPIGSVPPDTRATLSRNAIVGESSQGTLTLTGTADKSYPITVQRGFDAVSAAPWVQAELTQEPYDALPKVKTVRFDSGDGKATEFVLGSVTGAESLLDKCRLHILNEWGIDPARLVALPESAGSWFKYDDYPAAARRRGAQGRVIAAIEAGQDGVLKSCRVVVTSGATELDDTTCATVLARGSLPPAKGMEARIAIIHINWTLQDD